MSCRIVLRKRSTIFPKKRSILQLETSYRLFINEIHKNIQKIYCNIQTAQYSVCCVCHKTHYETLGIERNATSKEIKDAYIKLGKELHPDLHHKNETQENGQNSKENEIYTAQFKTLNEAYSVLSKPHSKRMYDLSLPGRHQHNSTTSVYRKTRESDWHPYEPMGSTAGERAEKMYGYKVDPHYWDRHDRRANKRKVVIFCILWASFGAIAQITLVNWATKRQNKHLNEQHKKSVKYLEEEQRLAMNRYESVNGNREEYEKRLLQLYGSNKVPGIDKTE